MQQKVFHYELKKLIYDKERLIFCLGLFLLILFVGFFIVFHWLGEGSNSYQPVYKEPWSDETETLFIKAKENAYQDYLVAIGKESYPQDGQIHILRKADESWDRYLYYDSMLRIKNTWLWEGYSVHQNLFISDVGYGNYTFLKTARLFYFQDFIFMVLPILVCFEVQQVFLKDKTSGFEKNYITLTTDRKGIFLGKLSFLLSEHAGLIFILFLCALFFSSNDQMLIHVGNFYLARPVFFVFLERNIEMYLVSLSFMLFTVFLSKALNNKSLFFWFSLPLNSLLLLGYPQIHSCLSSTSSNNHIKYIPFLNMISSDGFVDGFFWYRLIFPFLLILLTLICFSIRFREKPMAPSK